MSRPTVTAADAPPLMMADEITWTLSPEPTWTPPDDVLDAALVLLPEITDTDVADLVEALSIALEEAREQTDALRLTLSVALEQLRVADRETTRLKARLIELLNAGRAAA